VFVEEMTRVSGWITSTSASKAVQALDGYVPAVQSVHILAIAAVIASGAMLNLRLLGVMNAGVSMATMGERFSRPIWIGVAVLAMSGLALLLAEPERSLVSRVFQLKMAMLIIAIVLTLRLHKNTKLRAGEWDALGRAPATVRVAAATAMLLWACIIFAGRWIAYAQY
jgi:hypothetical protein